MTIAGLALASLGGLLFLWGAVGRFASGDYSDADGDLMWLGFVLGFWGAFLIAMGAR